MRQILNTYSRLIILFLFFIASFTASAQSTFPEVDTTVFDNRGLIFPYQIKKYALKAAKANDVHTAIVYLEKYLIINPDGLNTKYKLAEMYKQIKDYEKALLLFTAIEGEDGASYPRIYFEIAEIQKTLAFIEESKENMKIFKKELKRVKDRSKYKKLHKSSSKGMKKMELYKDSLPVAAVTVLNKKINYPHIEFNPIPVSENEIIFASLRTKETPVYDTEDEENTFLKRRFHVAKGTGKDWTYEGEWLDGFFNDSTADVGNGVFNLEKNKFYFSKCTRDVKNNVMCKIYASEKTKDGWSEPEMLPEPVNQEGISSSMPTLGTEPKRNFEVLYFVSDREKGRGGKDIWYSIFDRRKQVYKKPKNCGKRINTVGDDITPFYDAESRKMYFSSNGQSGYGGLDVYSTEGHSKKWKKPTHLGAPINTGYDEQYFVIHKNREEGFFTSNRGSEPGSLVNKNCCDDIYHFKWTKYININAVGTIADENNSSKGVRINVMIIDDEGNTAFVKEVAPDSLGNYDIKLEPEKEYQLRYVKEGFFTTSTPVSTKNTKESKSFTIDDIELKKIKDKAFKLDHILFKFDSAKLTDSSKISINEQLLNLMQANPYLIIEISAHTDDKGTDRYNKKLSQKRAESVVKLLRSEGINKAQMIAKGYGETMPIAPNQNEDGTDNPEGRELNRRTEFKVLGKLPSNFYDKGIDFDDETEEEDE